jgi:hypothetical protein
MKKERADEVPGRDLPAAGDALWADLYPRLHEHLVEITYDDGDARQTSTLLLVAEGGRFKGCLNDRDQSRSAWVSAETVNDVLAALELGLLNGSLDWRAKQAEWKGGKRK